MQITESHLTSKKFSSSQVTNILDVLSRLRHPPGDYVDAAMGQLMGEPKLSANLAA